MNLEKFRSPIRRCLFLSIFFGFLLSEAHAQDGWFMSATPPITVRFDHKELDCYAFFTNTGDKLIHAITVTVKKDGKEYSKIVIDTLEPHKTASLQGMELVNAGIISEENVFITCKDYSKPLQLKVEW